MECFFVVVVCLLKKKKKKKEPKLLWKNERDLKNERNTQ